MRRLFSLSLSLFFLMDDVQLLEILSDIWLFCCSLVGGFGLLWAADIVLILVGGLPDHKGCALVSS